MKCLLTFGFTLFFLPAVAFADNYEKTPVKSLRQPANIEIINGKKFFSLQNVRRFTGTLNNPGALSVMHHPRTTGGSTIRHSSPLPAVQAPATSASNTTVSKPDSDQILSIFAPEDKTVATQAPIKY